MAFKLGSGKNNYAVNGEIRKKMSFRGQAGETGLSVPGTPILRVPLEEGVLGEANMDGTIYINDQIEPGSFQERQVINHEMKHATDIKIGRLAYADDHIMYNGERFERADINGVDSILYEGQWMEAGTTTFPWEREANNGTR